ncbi:MAG: AI-2E family transporter [Myxococcales bacterium]|nr:AI-2E family transporter [Myxococcales bacterium]
MTDLSKRPTTPNEVIEAREETMRRATDIAVRLGALAIIVAWCLTIIAPFVGIVAWGLIIAIAVTGPYESVATTLGSRRGLTATLFVLLGFALIVVPAVLLSDTLVSGAQHFARDISDGSIEVPPPPAHVADWPIVGDQIYDIWSLAYENLTAALAKLGPQLQAVSAWLLKAAGSVGAGLLQLFGSLIVAGFILSRGADRAEAMEKLGSRLAGARRGPALVKLARATVSSVVQGIVGVALIQAILAGVGFVAADVPGAGLWAMLVLVSAIVQLPVGLVVIPPILLVFSSASTTVAVLFTLWCVFISLVDNFLKPILFGRGVEIPTIVIFVGAIGGMLSMGIIGLFVGSVVLAVGYELFKAWIDEDEASAQT